MLQPIDFQDLGMQVGFGLGTGHMEYRGMILKMHPGNIDGYRAFIGYDPDTGASIVATANLEEGDVMMPSLAALLNARKHWQYSAVSTAGVFQGPGPICTGSSCSSLGRCNARVPCRGGGILLDNASF
jgi:hypothetical protein